jgi:hypothetical protein
MVEPATESDPLESLYKMEFALDKEIADAKKLVGRGDTRFGSEEKLLEDLFDKESALRKLTESRKMAEITRKEREDTLSELETEKEYASRLADSTIKSKTAYKRMIDDSIKILMSEAKEHDAITDLERELKSHMSKITDMKEIKDKEFVTTKDELKKKFSQLDEKLKTLRLKDVASLTAEELKLLEAIPNDLKELKNKITKIKETLLSFRSSVDIAISKSASSYIDKTEKAESRRYALGIKESVTSSQIVDLCFLMDATSSMTPWINLTKQKISEIITSVKVKYPSAKFYISVVAYRDFDQGEKSFQVLPFTNETTEVETFLSTVEARGGADEAEDINGGFQRLLELEWHNRTKVLIHFADAPCHGSRFANESDDHPSPSTDMDWGKIFVEVKSLGIDYYFMQIRSKTIKMTNTFREIWDESGVYYKNYKQRPVVFKVQSIEDKADIFVERIEGSIMDSIHRSIKASERGLKKIGGTGKKLRVDEIIPEEKDEL